MNKDDFNGVSLALLKDPNKANQFLNDKPIKAKLNLLLSPPLMVIIVLLALLLINGLSNIYAQYRVNQIVGVSQVLAQVAHNFAVERGLTAGFMGSKGTKGGDKVKAQRVKADAAAGALMGELSGLHGLALNPRAEQFLEELEALLQQRDTLRKKVDALDSNSGFFQFYSSINSHSLRIVEQLSAYLDDKTILSSYKALTQLLWLKERAGQSRGALNGVFTAGDYLPSRAISIQTFFEQQEYLESEFALYADDEQKAFFDSVINVPSKTRVADMRKRFLDNFHLRQDVDHVIALLPKVANSETRGKIIGLLEDAMKYGTAEENRILKEDIDKINSGNFDTASLSAQLVKMEELPEMSASEWFTQATDRIGNINKSVMQLSSEISNRTLINIFVTAFWNILLVVVGLFALRFSQKIGEFIANSITSNLNKIQELLADVKSSYRFNTKVEFAGTDEIAKTAKDFGELLQTMDIAFSDIGDLGESLAEGRLKDAKIKNQYKGDIQKLADSLEKSASQLSFVFSEIDKSMLAASKGRFDVLVDGEMSGEFLQLKENINVMLKDSDVAISGVGESVSALAQGQLNATDASQYNGKFAELVKSNNAAVEKLKTVIEEDIQNLIVSAKKGELSSRIALEGKQGCFAMLSSGINDIMSSNEVFISDVSKTISGLAQGDLSVNMMGNYEGDFAVVQTGINGTIDTLSEVVETELDAVVGKSVEGDLSHRVDLDAKQGFILNLGKKINNLLQINQNVINDIDSALSALEKGDLNTKISSNYSGQFEQIKIKANQTSDNLRRIILEEVQSVIDKTKQGDLSIRIPDKGKEGCFMVLSQGINEIIDVTDGAVHDFKNMMQKLADGDLKHQITQEHKGVFGELKQSANDSVRQISQVMEEVASVASSVQMGSGQIADANGDLSSIAASQAASLEEVGASIEEIVASLKENNQKVSETEKMISQVSSSASESEEIALDALSRMEDISESSKRIEDIIGVIDEIAFQTNLLALNAAVEAARAGEQGRGFNVVASEVRNLAQRSASSAHEIKSLIAESVKTVEDGSKQVQMSCNASQKIKDVVKGANDKIAQVSRLIGSQEQHIHQISQSMHSVQNGIQQNASTVEEVSASSRSLASEADNMNKTIGFFAY